MANGKSLERMAREYASMSAAVVHGWHVIARGSDGEFCLAHNGGTVREGEWFRVDGEVNICRSGLHLSRRLSGAMVNVKRDRRLRYAVTRCALHGEIDRFSLSQSDLYQYHFTKWVGRRRKIEQVVDCREALLRVLDHLVCRASIPGSVYVAALGGQVSTEFARAFTERDIDLPPMVPVWAEHGWSIRDALFGLRDGFDEYRVVGACIDVMRLLYRNSMDEAGLVGKASLRAFDELGRMMEQEVGGEVLL